jgi:hypothetical protein
MRFARWENIIVVALLTLFLAAPAEGKISPEESAPFTDYGSFLGEYRAAGAFKFYDNTEALLRMAQFELALMRYRFLKGQIQRSGDYRGLVNMVDLRLKFLKKQMHLRETDIAAIPPRKVRIPKVKPPEAKPPPEKPAAAKPKTPGDADLDKARAEPPLPGLPPAAVIPGSPGKAGPPPAAPPLAAPPAAPGKPPEVVVTDAPKAKEDGKAKDDKAEEEKDKEEKPPPPPPRFWERLKIKLHLKKKVPESG